MMITKLALVLACLMSATLGPKEANVTPLFSKDLPDFPGKEGLMITVEYPPAPRIPCIVTTQMHLFMCLRAQS
jgi:hypothetical protein